MATHENNLPQSIDYVCPDCKGSLRQLKCNGCGIQFQLSNGVPNLLSRQPRFESAISISATYDTIYSDHSNVWEDQGRPKEFIDYFAALVGRRSTGRVLEIGCGEGILLAAIKADSKTAIDISSLALVKTLKRTPADCAVAIAERLPYRDGSFDAVLSVGVMEHFLDENAATTEICRVLRPGGSYVALIHVHATVGQRFKQKLREFVLPPRPVALVRWIVKKLYRPIHQPLQTHYSVASGRACMERNGFVVEQVITEKDRPRPPLAGPHVVIYVSRKAAAS